MPIKTKIAEQISNEINDYLLEKEILDGFFTLAKDQETSVEHLTSQRVDDSDGYMTLLSEGTVLFKDGSIRLYIAKGTLQKFYDSIGDDYEGYVTVGHVSLDTFPVREGYYRKSDLKIVTDENGRSDLLVKPHVNLEMSQMKDLILQDEPFAISSEFMWQEMAIGANDLEAYKKIAEYNQSKGGSDKVPITDSVYITGFSFVGNPGNAKSGGYEPSILTRNEEERLSKESVLDKLLNSLSGEAKQENLATEQAETETVEEVVEEKTTVDVNNEVEEALDKAVAEIEALRAENTDLKAQIEDLTAYKETKEKEDEVFASKLEKLNTLLGDNELKVVSPTVEEKSEKFTSTGLRKRFSGLKEEDN